MITLLAQSLIALLVSHLKLNGCEGPWSGHVLAMFREKQGGVDSAGETGQVRWALEDHGKNLEFLFQV